MRITLFEWISPATRSLRFMESFAILGHEVAVVRGIKPNGPEEPSSEFREVAPLHFDATFEIHPRNPLFELTKAHKLGKLALATATPSMNNAGFGNPHTLIPNWLKACELIKNSNCDLIWATDLDSLPAGIWASQALAVPIVYQADELFQSLDYINPIWQEEWNQIADKFIPLADCVITVSDDIAEVLRKENNARNTSVIHNLTEGSKSKAPATIRDLLSLTDSETLAVIVGNVVEHRGIEFAIQCLRSNQRLHVGVVGSGAPTYIESLLELASEFNVSQQIHFVGNIEYSFLADFLSSADFNFMAYSADTSRNHKFSMPNKLFDGLAAGLPTIVCSGTTAGKFLEELGLGKTYTQDSVESLMNTIINVREMKSFVDSQKHNFYWDQNLSKIDSVIRLALARS